MNNKREFIYNKRQIGHEYERQAAKFLEDKGYHVLVLNYQNRIGEIDIIAMDGECIVFVEVKYRKSSKYGFPIEAAVNYQKQKNIIMVANYFIMMNRITNKQIRFDVISILGNKIQHVQNAFGV